MFCHGCCHENPEGSNKEFHQSSPPFPAQRRGPDIAALSLLNKGPSAALAAEHMLWTCVYSDKRWRDGEKQEDNFQLKTCVELLWGLLCFCLFVRFFKERTAILRFEHCHKRKKNRSDRSRGMKTDIFPLHPVCSRVLHEPEASPLYTLIEEPSFCFPRLVLVVKNPPVNAGDVGSIAGLGRFPGEGNGNWLQYSCLGRSHGQRSLVGYSP